MYTTLGNGWGIEKERGDREKERGRERKRGVRGRERAREGEREYYMCLEEREQ